MEDAPGGATPRYLDVADHFTAGPGYLNTASVGLPPKATVTALGDVIARWAAGDCDPPAFDADVDRCRRAYARIVGADPGSVAIVGQVSVATGLVASSLPDGAVVLCAEEDFTSVLFPFLADSRLDVRTVPLDRLIDAVGAETDLVAVSAVQSADGRMLDLDHLVERARDTGTRTYLDLSQAAGWLPIAAERFDVTAAGAYKWLLCPRGTGFLTVREGVDWLVPRHASWYGGGDIWTSLYGPPLRLADGARRFDVSPAWFDFVGAAESLELVAGIGVEAVGAHSVGLADALRSRLGLPGSDSAVVSVATDRGPSLAAAGVTAAVRAGRVRLSFYVYNTAADVDLLADLLTA